MFPAVGDADGNDSFLLELMFEDNDDGIGENTVDFTGAGGEVAAGELRRIHFHGHEEHALVVFFGFLDGRVEIERSGRDMSVGSLETAIIDATHEEQAINAAVAFFVERIAEKAFGFDGGVRKGTQRDFECVLEEGAGCLEEWLAGELGEGGFEGHGGKEGGVQMATVNQRMRSQFSGSYCSSSA